LLLADFIALATQSTHTPPARRILSVVQPNNLPSLEMHAKFDFLTSGTLYLRENDLRLLLLKQLPLPEK
jgi:L-amino acid N-acyltransferase YncA